MPRKKLRLDETNRTELASLYTELEATDPLLTFVPFGMQVKAIQAWKHGAFGIARPHGIVLHGGPRSGKSTVAAHMLASELTANKKLIYGVTIDEKLSKEGQQQIMHGMMPEWAKRGGRYIYTQEAGYQRNMFSLYNGSMMFFKFYTQQEDTRQSTKQHVHWYDEEIDIEDFKLYDRRLWDYNGRFIMSALSRKGMTPLLTMFHNGATTAETRYAELAHRELPTVLVNQKMKVIIFFLWSVDNPYISQEAVTNSAAMMTQDEILTNIYGIPRKLGGTVYPQFSLDAHVVEGLKYQPVDRNAILISVIDPHDERPWVMAWAWFNPWNGSIRFIYEWPDNDYKVETSAPTYHGGDYARIVRMKEQLILHNNKNRVVRIMDPRGGNTAKIGAYRRETYMEILADHGLYYEPAPCTKENEVGHDWVRAALAYRQTEPLSDTNKPKLLFDGSLYNTIRYMQNYNFTEVDEWKCFCDLVRYVCGYCHLYGGGEKSFYGSKDKPGTIGGVKMGYNVRR